MADCSISGCDGAVFARGWCSKHYTRWHRRGDPAVRMRGEVVDGKKICPGCQEDKPLSEYGCRKDARCLACQAAAARARRLVNSTPQVPHFDAVCGHCSAPFKANKRRWRYCSPECSAAREYKDNWKNVAGRRVKERAATVERFTREEIFERDGWVCQICLEPIDPTVKKPDTRCASIDHVVPISLGGEHSRANVQAAHLVCNLIKGARIDVEVIA